MNPFEMVKKDLEKIDFHIVQHGVNKFKEASEDHEKGRSYSIYTR